MTISTRGEVMIGNRTLPEIQAGAKAPPRLGWFKQTVVCKKDKTAFSHEGETILRCNLRQGKAACMLSKCPKEEGA